MAVNEIVIANAGLITPAGLSLKETAASARARVARLREIDWRDRRFEPFIVGTVPDEGLPELAEPLTKMPLQPREARMLRLAHAALEEAAAPIAEQLRSRKQRVPLLLGLPEHHTTQPLDPRRFLARLDQQCPDTIDLAASVAAPRGRAAGLMALRQAQRWLAEGTHRQVLVGGVDSLVDLYVLGTLDMQQRIRGETVSDGFTPSEGAAMLLLATAGEAQAHKLATLAQVLGAAAGQEAGHLYAEEPYRGDGLAGTFAQLFEQTPPPQPVATVYCSFNGERYWAREFGVARTRQAAAFGPDAAMEHPAEVFGDLGAAHGPALLALAAHALREGYRAAPCLVYASSDHADRAAALLAKAA
jgi:3-oxoacyl-[acyl-carrier-protein] synthase-1